MPPRRANKSKEPQHEQNQRLDLFLQELEIAQDKREKILQYVEDLTFSVLQQKNPPRLRLNQPDLGNSSVK